MAIGERLIEERDRLHLSRADFAERAGVHLNTQARYETNKRAPDAGYLETIKIMGVDVNYVLFGVPDALVECPYLVEQEANNTLISLDKCRDEASGRLLRLGLGGRAHRQWNAACQKCPNNPFKYGYPASHKPQDIDGRLLTTILEELELSLERTGHKLPPAQKALAVVMLYRACRARGKIEQSMIEDTIAIIK